MMPLSVTFAEFKDERQPDMFSSYTGKYAESDRIKLSKPHELLFQQPHKNKSFDKDDDKYDRIELSGNFG